VLAVLTSCDPAFVWLRRASPVTFDVCSVVCSVAWRTGHGQTDGEMCGLRMGPLADFDPQNISHVWIDCRSL